MLSLKILKNSNLKQFSNNLNKNCINSFFNERITESSQLKFLRLTFSKNIHTTACNCRFHETTRKGEYLKPSFRDEFNKEQRENWYGLKDGFKTLRQELVKWKDEVKETYESENSAFYVHDYDREKIWDFSKPEMIQKFQTISDIDHSEGFSRCEFIRSQTDRALFHGFINSEPPKDGRVTFSGYCSVKSFPKMKSFSRPDWHDWQYYTCLVMRVRGDGRTYMINLSTAGVFDITWNDIYSYFLYTRGGPYWQFVKIPFSKFVFGSKGRVQDVQHRIPLWNIQSVGITAGKEDGPFNLEIDYIGVEADPKFKEEFAYEMYNIPPYIVNV